MSYRQLLNTATGLINSNLLPVSGTPYINEEQLIVASQVLNLDGAVENQNYNGYIDLSSVTIPSAWTSNYSKIQETVTITFNNVQVDASQGSYNTDSSITLLSFLDNGEIYTNAGDKIATNLYTAGTVATNPATANYFNGTTTAVEYIDSSVVVANLLLQTMYFKIANEDNQAGNAMVLIIPNSINYGVITRTFKPYN